MKKDTQYICQSCGSISKKWLGQCPDCNEWNTIQEEQISLTSRGKILKSTDHKLEFQSLVGECSEQIRLDTNIQELNRVLGGGLVQGSAILIGGDPGIGKSTILLQLVSKLSFSGISCAYVTGEESITQVRLRAQRLGANNPDVKLLAATNVYDILNLSMQEKSIKLLVIDSIQTMFTSEYASAPGTVSQVKASAYELINFAKKNNVILLLVGHVTKDGQLAGPKILEHMVDTVLYFEGDASYNFRILRAVKNRFGGVNEIGIFEMQDVGLREINNPSELFLSTSSKQTSGSAVFAGIEGSRPILVEIQALVAKSYLPTPRRSVVGWDINRLSMILAVLSVRYGISFAEKEVYLNVVGGLKITETAADLAVVCALISACTNISMPKRSVIFGEVGLSGEIRKVSQSEVRIKEARKLGYENAIVPLTTKDLSIISSEIKFQEIGHIKQLHDYFNS